MLIRYDARFILPMLVSPMMRLIMKYSRNATLARHNTCRIPGKTLRSSANACRIIEAWWVSEWLHPSNATLIESSQPLEAYWFVAARCVWEVELAVFRWFFVISVCFCPASVTCACACPSYHILSEPDNLVIQGQYIREILRLMCLLSRDPLH